MDLLMRTCLLLLLSGVVTAQDINNYTFTTGTNESLVDMSSGTTTLIGSNSTEVSSALTNIGFDFYFMGEHFDQFSVNANGVLRFGPTIVFNLGFDFNLDGQYRIVPFSRDNQVNTQLGTSGVGKVHYKVTGTAPDRVMIVEWLSMEILFDNSALVDNGTFQVRIYESGPFSSQKGRFDIIYGNMSVANNGNGLGFNVGAGSGSAATEFAGVLTTGPTLTPGTENTQFYAAGNIANLNSSSNGNRRYFYFDNSGSVPATEPTVATVDCISNASINLSWTHTVTNEAAYAIYRSTDNVNFSFLTTVPNTTTSYTDMNLSASTAYYYRVYSLTEGTLSGLAATGANSATTTNDADLVYSIASGLWNDDAVWSSASFPTSTKNVIIGCGEGQSITKSSSAGSALNVVVESGSVLNLSASSNALTTQGDVTIRGTLNVNGGNMTVNGDFTNNGTANQNSGSVSVTGDFTNTSTYTTSGGNLTLRSDFSNQGSFDLGTGGTLTITGASAKTLTNTGTSLLSTAQEYSVSGTSAITGDGNLATGNNYPSAATLTSCTGCGVLSVTVPVVGSNASLSSFTLSLTHDYVTDVDLYVLSPDNTVFVLATDRGPNGPGSYDNVTYSDIGTSFTPVGAAIPANQTYAPDVGLGQFTSYTGPITGTWTLYANDDFVTEDDGELSDFEVGIVLNISSSELHLNNLVVNSGGNTVLNSPIHVFGELSLTDGNLVTDAINLLTMEDNSSVSGGSSASFIDGPMEKTGMEAFDFPVGNNGVFAKIGIGTPSSQSTFLAEYTDGAYMNISDFENTINTVSNVEHWSLSETSGSGASATVKLFSADLTRSKLTNPSDIVVAHFTGSKWENEGATYSVVDGSFVTTNALNSFSPFTFGSTSPSTPLPIRMVSFYGQHTPAGNRLAWETASEQDNDYFKVQRSLDGRQWEDIGKVEGSGTSHTPKAYAYLDIDKLPNITYYRLEQVDFNGDAFLTEPIAIDKGMNRAFELIAYHPNPVLDNLTIEYYTSEEAETRFLVVDLSGRVLSGQTQESRMGKNRFQLDTSTLDPGLYFFTIVQDEKSMTQKFIHR